ncbi:MAG: hypothetical protein IPL61_25605 [Myxococcales bacterium]|nr:hypothetical protein [Myxococcales bacterium]
MTPAVGADIESLCSKCGDVWHVIVAKVGEQIVRVICKECGGQHRYKNPKLPPGTKTRAASTPRSPRSTRPVKVVARFETPAVAADLNKPPRAYAASERFAIGERVEHPTFGQGVVEALELGKMTVFFAVGRKVLACGKGEAGAAGGLTRPKPFEHRPAGAPPDAAPVAVASDDDVG